MLLALLALLRILLYSTTFNIEDLLMSSASLLESFQFGKHVPTPNPRFHSDSTGRPAMTGKTISCTDKQASIFSKAPPLVRTLAHPRRVL